MNLTTKIFKTFLFIFIAQLAIVGLWAISLYSSNNELYPASVITGLTKVDQSILEGIILQDKIGSTLARDLIVYKLLELNNVDTAEFLRPAPLKKIVKSLNLSNCIEQKEITICSRINNKIALSLIPLKVGDSIEGYLKLEKSLTFNDEVNKKILETIAITVLVVFLINAFTLIMIWWTFLRPETSRLIRVFETEKEDPKIGIKEFKKIQDGFLAAISRVKIAESEKTQMVTELEKVNLATQVAHDVRSPLEVLKGLKDDLANLPEGSRKRIQMAVNRIEEITFNLLKTHKQNTQNIDTNSEELLSIIASVVLEKNIELRNREGIELIESFNANSYGLFSNIQRSALKSIISNLVNNGVESTNGINGKISISLFSEGSLNKISIIDNGHGIPSELAPNLFTRGFTTKRTGNGLGLYNAKLELEAVGGTIEFESVVGKGTTFTISLPKSEMPATFVESINAYKYERIIVLDDDPAFHEVWNKRLEGLEAKVEHIHSVEEMLAKYQVLHPKILLLSDFELMDKQYDGIDTILKLNHAENSILVTARSEEQAIQDRCLKAGIKLLPKSLVNYVMVRMTGMPMSTGSEGIGKGLDLVKELSESSQAQLDPSGVVGGGLSPVISNSVPLIPMNSKFGQVEETQGGEGEACALYVAADDSRSGDAQDGENQKLTILIDDDKLIRLNWAAHFKKKDIPFQSFSSIDEFLAASATIDKASKIYIDSNLGDGIKGEVESERIFVLGFLNLYMATGYEKDSIQKPHWIKEVFSKSPENVG